MMNLHRLLLCAAVALCAACDRPRNSDRINAVFQRPDLHPVHLGLTQDTSRAGTLGIIVAARLTEGGSNVVVLDGVPPFIKVFDRRGRLRSAFVEKGGGPREMGGPATMAISPQSTILVADYQGRLSEYDLDGKLLHQGMPKDILPLAAAPMCDGEWLVYGPRFRDGSYHHATWLHRIRFTADSLQSRSVFADSLASEGIGVGRPYGMVSTGDAVMVRHDLGANPSILTLGCNDSAPRVTLLPRSAREKRASMGSPNRPKQVSLGTRVHTGLAALGRDFVQADLTVGKTPQESTTILDLMRNGRSIKVAVPGFYVLRDSKPGLGVLVESEDPVPQLFLIPENEFLSLFTR